MSLEFRSRYSIKTQINSGRHLETNVLGNLNWQKYTIALGSLTEPYKHLGKGSMISYLLFWFLQVPLYHPKLGLNLATS